MIFKQCHIIQSEKWSATDEKQERAYSGLQILPAWRLDRKIRRRLILQET